MFEVIKKQSIVFFVCFVISFIICFFYPVKKDLYLGIKNFFNSRTVVDTNGIVTVNYKRAPEDYKEFIVSGSNPVLIINLGNRYIEDAEINFKEQLKENLQLKIYIEKDNSLSDDNKDSEIIKVTDIETIKENISYRAKIDTFFNKLIFVIGKQVGDSFVIDNITYSESYKYYWNEIFRYSYSKQLKAKNYWLKVLKLFGLFMLFVEYFIIRKDIYKKIGKTK